ncbi:MULTISPECIES: hybrid sensor histidine kinase/response regulator [Caballeronia]|uniref:hybrid sensor histidine kinase/response regulator n=1 Tax=Caballeronia TaxID=1827195 RepID=UPI001EF4D13E|nr:MULTISPECIES: hybrid sensor histidine kinase/response regulator [Caballeronia]MCG7402970.1 response regulator [Caballeronia zhejiangensis]
MPLRHLSWITGGPAETIARTHFSNMRRAFLLARFLTVLTPAIFLSLYGWQDWHDRLAAAEDAAQRSTYIAEEHAQKILDIDAALAERVLDSLETDSMPGSSDVAFFDRLERLVHGYAQVDALSVFSADGRLIATSLRFPAPHVDIADRADFRDLNARPTALYISGPMTGRVTGKATFNVMKGHLRTDGKFEGLVSIAMSPEYFENFYRRVVAADPITIGMVRGDGAVLAWYPYFSSRPERISTNTPFFALLSSGREAGLVTMKSSVDGEEKILAFRRVGNYDAYVTAGIPLRVIRSAWLGRLSVVAMATAVPCLALFVLILFSLRRLNHEARLWLHAENETSKRAAVEVAAKENQRVEAVGNMVALVAHDFNNLLMGILGFTQAASRQAPQQQKQSFEGILSVVQRGQNLTRRLLSVSKKQPLRPQSISLVDWSKQMGLLQSAVGEGVVIDTSAQDGLWDIRADLAEFELALLNVAINARDAMNARGRLTIAFSNLVEESGHSNLAPGEYVRIDVVDTGPGIDDATAKHAFEPFFSTKPPGQGTGLGLSQVRSFCELAGGHCSIARTVTNGTVVSLFIPRGATTSVDPTAPSQTRETVAKPQTVRMLLVEDDELVAEAQAAMFSAFGYDVTCSPSADDAYIRLQPPHGFHVVISDVQMPGSMTGIELAEYLQDTQPELPLMMVTGFVDQAERLRRLGVTAFLKPLTDMDAVDEWIQRRVRSYEEQDILRADPGRR